MHLHKGCVVYPNPVGGILNVELQHPGEESLKFQIVDVQGRVVQEFKQQHILGKQLFQFILSDDVSDGIYFLVARTRKGKVSSRFILDRV